MLNYPINLTLDSNGYYLVYFPDIPEANSVGENQNKAISNALDALKTAIEIYIDQGRPIPLPSTAKLNDYLVPLPLAWEVVVLRWNELARNQNKSSSQPTTDASQSGSSRC